MEYKSTSGEKITRYYCTCKIGARTLGCCSHVASVIWYLGYRRHTGGDFNPPPFGQDVLDAAIVTEKSPVFVESNDSTDSDDEEIDEDEIETEPENLPSDDEYYIEHFTALQKIRQMEKNVGETAKDSSDESDVEEFYVSLGN